MADVKSAQALLNDLPKNDVLKSVLYLAECIESVGIQKDFNPTDQFAVLNLLNDTALPLARKLAYEYFTQQNINSFHGNRMCMALEGLFRHSADAYYEMFKRNKTSVKPQLLTVRIIRVMREQLKYASAQYKYQEATIWTRLAELYQHAEQQLYLETSLNLQPAAQETTSVMHESAVLLAWYVCGINSQHPRNMHLTERIIAHYGHFITISPSLSGQALFGINLADSQGPLRINNSTPMYPTMRYFSLFGMQKEIEVLVDNLEQKTIPQGLNLGGAFPAEQVLEAARHVLNYLLAPPSRESKRLKLNVTMNVVVNYSNMVLRCHALEHKGIDVQPAQWLVENVSYGGFRAVISSRDTVQIGNLLGIQMPGVSHMGAAIVRNLLRNSEGQMCVGAEILANQVSEVNILFSMGTGTERSQSALWLHDKSSAENGIVMLLMRPCTFSMLRSMKTSINGRNYLLLPSELKISDSDFDLASYRFVEQE